MVAIERLHQIPTFNSTELISILSEDEFNYRRAGRWMDDHVVFAMQMVVLYLTVIFSLKQWMRGRAPYKLRMPLASWNFAIANLSGLSGLAMTYQLLSTLYYRGLNATICSTQDEFYSGMMGYAMFVLLLARLPEFIDTFFIVLRKQPLLFIHWYHHACTLCVGWFTYSTAFPAAAHLMYINAGIHTAMYSYYFITALGMRPPTLVAKTITIWQVMQFAVAVYGMLYVCWIHYIGGAPCAITTETYGVILAMMSSYLYLFSDFFITKYSGRVVPEHKQLLKKSASALAMLSIDQLHKLPTFNNTELVNILSEDEFDYRRAGRWMDDHVVFALQMIVIYLTVIFSLKQWMRNRAPYKLRIQLAAWNFFIANLSGLSALAMSYQLAEAAYFQGVNATICSTRDEFYSGRMGYAMFVLLLARMPEFVDTFFIVLRKQPLLFIHWYHHACTLFVGWFTYSTFFPAAAHIIFINANIHTAMYSYYFVTALGMKPPNLVAKSITFWQVCQFVVALYGMGYVTYINYVMDLPCHMDQTTFYVYLAMFLSYLYLFSDFFITKYTGRTVAEHKQLLKKRA